MNNDSIDDAIQNMQRAVSEFASAVSDAFVPALAVITDAFHDVIETILPAMSPEKRFELFGADGLDFDDPVDRWVYQKHILTTPVRLVKRLYYALLE